MHCGEESWSGMQQTVCVMLLWLLLWRADVYLSEREREKERGRERKGRERKWKAPLSAFTL